MEELGLSSQSIKELFGIKEEIVELQIKNLGEETVGYLSNRFILQVVSTSGEVTTAFVKAPITSPENPAFPLIQELELTNIEKKFYCYAYNKTLPVPKCFYPTPTDELSFGDLIFLEYLEEYKAPDYISGISLEEGKEIIKALAAIHACQEYWRYPNCPEIAEHKSDFEKDFSPLLGELFPPHVDMLSTYFKEIDKKHLMDIFESFKQLATNPAKYSKALCNGDCWIGNILRKRSPQNQNQLSIKVVDWQFTKVGNPLWDISYLLLSGMNEDVYRGHEEELIFEYYQSLLQHGVDSAKYTLDQCRIEYEVSKVFSLVVYISSLSAFYVPYLHHPQLEILQGRFKNLLEGATSAYVKYFQ